jgi:hypothetical protein
MISEETRATIAKAAAPRHTQRPVVQEPPVEFRVRSAMFFGGERAEPGAVLRVPMVDAISLLGNWHAELVNAEDAVRIRDASRRFVLEETKDKSQRDSFVDRYLRN